MQRKSTERAKDLLKTPGTTLALCNGETEILSQKRGVAPLVELLENKKYLNGFSAADKVVGKGAAFLYVLLNIDAVYAAVISRPALDVLVKHGIATEYGTLVENIINRRGDGICPIETAVLGIDEPTKAYEAIQKKLLELNQKQ